MKMLLVDREVEPQWSILCMLWNYLLKLEKCTVYNQVDPREINTQVYANTIPFFLTVPNHTTQCHQTRTHGAGDDSVSEVPATQARGPELGHARMQKARYSCRHPQWQQEDPGATIKRPCLTKESNWGRYQTSTSAYHSQVHTCVHIHNIEHIKKCKHTYATIINKNKRLIWAYMLQWSSTTQQEVKIRNKRFHTKFICSYKLSRFIKLTHHWGWGQDGGPISWQGVEPKKGHGCFRFSLSCH